MNQILYINNQIYNKKFFYIKKFYFYLFSVSISAFVLLLLYCCHLYFNKISENKKTNLLKNKYNINTLYPTNTKYTSLKLFNNVYIIGLIEIPKLQISYPIIENTDENLLKISVCRFSGPLPNRVGNLCVAGHNYKNNSLFSNLHKLNVGDFFYITDLNNTRLKYIIYKKFIVEEDNLSCIENSNNIEVTLITCYNNNSSKRLIIKAKMEE